ncbi:MAG: TPM domain-containing protein, partial [Desulfofustis sp.]|nr:TPM domain-containing protein [Desulfofustis sp.]
MRRRVAVPRWLRLAATILLILFIPRPVEALPVPKLSGRVNDYAGMLAPATTRQLETVLADLETSDSTQIVVLTIASLEGDSLEDFSLRVVEQWRIGQQDLDNGALLLVARDDRKLRIEVGYGLEGSLTDLVAGQIIRTVITPHFRLGNFDQGIIDGVGAMIAAVRGEFQAATNQRNQRPAGDDPGGLITVLVFLFFIFGSMFRRNKPLAAVTGGIAAPLIALLLFGITGMLLLLLIPAGALGGLIAASLSGNSNITRSGGLGGWHHSGGGMGGGGFGGFGGGGGG